MWLSAGRQRASAKSRETPWIGHHVYHRSIISLQEYFSYETRALATEVAQKRKYNHKIKSINWRGFLSRRRFSFPRMEQRGLLRHHWTWSCSVTPSVFDLLNMNWCKESNFRAFKHKLQSWRSPGRKLTSVREYSLPFILKWGHRRSRHFTLWSTHLHLLQGSWY